MNNYYDTVLANLLGTGMFGPTQQAGARSMASETEDAMLRRMLGSKRKLGKNERMPEGSYALADYPGLGSAVDWARTGNTPVGSMGIGQWLAEFRDPNKEQQGRRQRQMWAEMQSRLLGGRY